MHTVINRRRCCENLLHDWEQIEQNHRQLKEVRGQIESRYHLFEQATEEDRQLLEGGEARKIRLDRNYTQARDEARRQQEQRSQYEEAKKRYEEGLDEIGQMPTDAVRKKMELLQKPKPTLRSPNIKPALAVTFAGAVLLITAFLLDG